MTSFKSAKVVASSSGGLSHTWMTTASPLVIGRQGGSLGTEGPGLPRQSRPITKTYQCAYCQSVSIRYSQRRRAHTASSSQNIPDTYWPSLPLNKPPTPYDILSHPPSGPYNKRRFNHLVKLYHPDSPTPSPAPSGHPCTLSPTLRLERYHLIIQAHTLLSTPSLRSAYDRHGAGWATTPSLDDLRREDSARGWAAAQDFRKETPSHCATWEDWEEWWSKQARRKAEADENLFHHDFTRQSGPQSKAERQAWWVAWVHEQSRWQPRGGGRASGNHKAQSNPGFYSSNMSRQVPLYTSNGIFILLVAACSMGGIMYEISRAGRNSTSFLAQLEATNQSSWTELNRSRKESRECETKGERVGKFLKDRGEDPIFGRAIYGKILDGDGHGHEQETKFDRERRQKKMV